MEKREALTIGKSPISKEEKRIGKQFPELRNYQYGQALNQATFEVFLA